MSATPVPLILYFQRLLVVLQPPVSSRPAGFPVSTAASLDLSPFPVFYL